MKTPDFYHLFKSFQSLHRIAERDKKLISRCTEILAQETDHPLQKIQNDILKTYELEELIIYLYSKEKHQLIPVSPSTTSPSTASPISLEWTIFNQGPTHKKVTVISHLNDYWQVDPENFVYASVVWVPIHVAGKFIGCLISRSKKPRQDFTIISESIQMITSPIGYYLKNTELTEKLTAERNRAQQLAQIKSDFLAMMSHELRTPLNGVIGMTELLKEEDLNERQEEFANIILGSGESLLSLINDILDYSKIEAGKMKLEHIPFNLRKTIKEVSSIFKLTLKRHPVDFIVNLDEALPENIIGDPGRLKQLFNNLLGNAIKFTSQGFIKFNVKVLEQKGDHVTISFEVKDSGVGIAKDKQKTIFESFAQESSDTFRKYGGTGLGLAICKQLCQLMKSEIVLYSTLGEGSTFSTQLTFALNKDAPSQKLLPNKKVNDLHILIVDDNPSVTQSLKLQLDSLSVKTELAHTGEEAISIMGKKHRDGTYFDAIITDRIMNNMDGFLFAETIHKKVDADIPIIMMTSRGLRGDAQKAQDHGLSAFITKPIRKNLLKRVLQLISDPNHRKEGDIITRYTFEHLDDCFKILIVEDNQTNQKVIHNILMDEGYEHEFANNGSEAVDMATHKEFDLIFMDINMPVMDGIEATGIIRNMNDHYKKIPIVALTAKYTDGSSEEYSEMGFSQCVAKPFRRDQLIDAIVRNSQSGSLAD